jgi:cobalt transporter subunit CbtB
MRLESSPAAPAKAAGGVRAVVAAQALLAALLGAFIVLGVGFSHASALHNAAHDVRHSNGFPCH